MGPMGMINFTWFWIFLGDWRVINIIYFSKTCLDPPRSKADSPPTAPATLAKPSPWWRCSVISTVTCNQLWKGSLYLHWWNLLFVYISNLDLVLWVLKTISLGTNITWNTMLVPRVHIKKYSERTVRLIKYAPPAVVAAHGLMDDDILWQIQSNGD